MLVTLPSQGQWTHVGLFGGTILDIVVTSNDKLFAATAAGVYSSSNGNSWSKIPSIPSITINGIEVHGNNMIVATNGSGEFLSSDNGMTWGTLSGAPAAVVSIVVCNGQFFGMTGNYDLLKLNAITKTWNVVDSGIAELRGLGSDGSNLFLGSQAAGIYKSTNEGVSWSPFNGGLSSSTIISLSSGGGKVITWTGNGSFVLSNGSSSWSSIPLPQGYVVIGGAGNLFIAGTHNDKFYQSNDGGSTWFERTDMPSFWAFATKGSELFIATGWGVFKSVDGGANWTDASDGISTLGVYDVSFDGDHAVAATDAGIYISADRGVSWVRNLSIPVRSRFTAAVLRGQTILVGTETAALRSDDTGLSWATLKSSMNTTHLSGITHAAIVGTVVYLTDPLQLFTLPLHGDATARYKMTEISGQAYYFTSLLAASDRLYYTLNAITGISELGYYTGTTGIAINDGIPVNNIYLTGVAASSTKLFATSLNGGFYVSSNNNDPLWSAAVPLLESTHVAFLNGNLFTAGLTDAGRIRISTDEGVSWSPHIDGLGPGIGHIRKLVPFENKLFAASEFGGLWFRTYPNNETITNLVSHEELPTLQISPNPAKDFLTVSLYGFEKGDEVEIGIVSVEGRVLHSIHALGGCLINIDISQIPAGIALIRAKSHAHSATARLMKLCDPN